MVNTYNLKQRFQIWFSNIEMLYNNSSFKGFVASHVASLISFNKKSNLFISVPYKMRTEHAYQAVFINKL